MIKESYNDCFLIEVKKETYEKIKDIIFFEETNKKQILTNIEVLKNKILEDTNITKIEIKNTISGYCVHYSIDNYNSSYNSIFCYTLSEVIIYLRSFIKRY